MEEDQKGEKSAYTVTDRRFWVRDDSLVDRAEVPEARYPSFVEELKAKTEAAQNKLQEKLQALDEENSAFRERLSRQLQSQLAQAKADFLKGFLEVLDNIERALEAGDQAASFDSLRQGVALTQNLFVSRLLSEGVEPVEPLGQPFDPSVAEAVEVVAVEDPEREDCVVEVVQKGYRMGDLLLRPAIVKVGRKR